MSSIAAYRSFCPQIDANTAGDISPGSDFLKRRPDPVDVRFERQIPAPGFFNVYQILVNFQQDGALCNRFVRYSDFAAKIRPSRNGYVPATPEKRAFVGESTRLRVHFILSFR